MKIQKLQISKEKTDINLQFYFFLKCIVKLHPTDSQIVAMCENLMLSQNTLLTNISTQLLNVLSSKKKNINSKLHNTKIEKIEDIISRFRNNEDVELFAFALKLYQIKDLLLQEAKIAEISGLNKLATLDPLSLEYDQISILKPYTTRVNGALLSLLFFDKLDKGETNFMSQDAYNYLCELAKTALFFREKGLELNQMFLLIFAEAIDQSIKSDSGSDYEARINSVLGKIGIPDISKIHDKHDISTEYDFFFRIDNISYGISAKKTLRERYKQFSKTAENSEVDVMIQITLGRDLTEEKAHTITSHGIYVFVADEIYQKREFLRKMDKIFSVKNLNLNTLKNLK